MSADASEKAELLEMVEHRTKLDRPNFEHFSLADLRRVVEKMDDGPRANGGLVILTEDEWSDMIRVAARTAIDAADEHREAQADIEADIEEHGIDARENAEHDTQATGPDALDRVDGGYPVGPELLSAAVAELRDEGREGDARRMIQEHPGIWAVAQQSDEDHSDLSPDSIRQNATGDDSPAEYRNWPDDADMRDLAPKHDWLDRSEWDVKRERREDDGDD